MALTLSAKAFAPVCARGPTAARQQRSITLVGASFRSHLVPAQTRRAPVISRNVTVKAAGPESDSEVSEMDTFSATSDWKGVFFGTYLQLGVWATVLSFAGYTSYQKMQVDPTEVGVLAGPPAGFALLTVSFLVFKAISNSQKQAKKAAKKAAEEQQQQ